MTEREFQEAVIAAARLLGLAVYHTYDSRRSTAGFPDLTIVGGDGVLFRELKTDTGRISPDQAYWLEALTQAGSDAGVWRPRDWPRITVELRALGRVPFSPPPPTQAQVRRRLQKRAS